MLEAGKMDEKQVPVCVDCEDGTQRCSAATVCARSGLSCEHPGVIQMRGPHSFEAFLSLVHIIFCLPFFCVVCAQRPARHADLVKAKSIIQDPV